MRSNLHTFTPTGTPLEASFSVDRTPSGFDVILESRSGGKGGKSKPRNPDYEKLFTKQYLDGVIGSPQWRQMRDDERVEFVKETLKEFRAAGRETLIERHPELKGADLGDEAAAPPAMIQGRPGKPPLRAPGKPAALPPGFVIDQ